ncbi:MAG TPA: hypothetical protein VGR73_13330 [Bryobacteraceae bacterium]|nr:hypothetical protein [Bryobacteraceae bacterium]
MSHKLLFALTAAAAVLASAPARASDIVYSGGGTLAQIVDGGGTNTIFTILNMDSVTAAYTLNFYDDNGNPLTLSTTAGAAGTSVSGALPSGGSAIIQTSGAGSAVLQGYAVLATTNQLAGSAVFGIPLATGTFAQASCPLDTGFDYIFAIPFDQTSDQTAAKTGVALVNSFGDAPYQTNGGDTVTLAATFYDQNGTTVALPSITLPLGQHTAFLLDQHYPQIAGQKGAVVFQGTDTKGSSYAFKVLGIRATGSTYTSITPIVPCNYSSNSQACTN